MNLRLGERWMMEIVSVKGTEASIWEKKNTYIYSSKGE